MTNAQYDIAAIGNAIVDIMRRCSDDFVAGLGVPKGNMNLVQSSADIAKTCAKLRLGIEVAGGSAANTAVGVASFGGRAAFIGKVAEDQYGRIFRHDIRGAGVTFTTPATTIAGKETSHSLILITPDGQRTMNTYLGCSTELDDTLIDAETIKNAKITYLEGYLFDAPAAKEAYRRATELAIAAGRTVALSLSDPYCVARHRPEFLELLHAGVGVLIANEREILSLYDVTDFDEAVRRVSGDTPLAVLTRSEKGSVIISNGWRPRCRPNGSRRSSMRPGPAISMPPASCLAFPMVTTSRRAGGSAVLRRQKLSARSAPGPRLGSVMSLECAAC